MLPIEQFDYRKIPERTLEMTVLTLALRRKDAGNYGTAKDRLRHCPRSIGSLPETFCSPIQEVAGLEIADDRILCRGEHVQDQEIENRRPRNSDRRRRSTRSELRDHAFFAFASGQLQ